MPTICLEGICFMLIQIPEHTTVGPFFSNVKLDIPPILARNVTIRNRVHHGNCSADPWNMEGHDSNGAFK